MTKPGIWLCWRENADVGKERRAAPTSECLDSRIRNTGCRSGGGSPYSETVASLQQWLISQQTKSFPDLTYAPG